MPLLDAGRDIIAAALVNSGPPTFFDNTNARIAVGNGTAAFDATDTDLQGASKFRKAMEATYPQIAANVLTFRALYSTAQANFAWEEWGIVNDASAGTMLNRKVETLGTKAATQSWLFTVTVTIVNEDA